jgi:ABC-type dipeptide/oligopeptide/nickel transport system ATPase component
LAEHPLLEVAGLSVAFGRRRIEAVHDVSFTVARGQRLGLVGESGSGKTVTATAIMGLLADNAQAAGSIRFDGEELTTASDQELSRLRGRSLTMVFQEPMTALDPTMTVGRQTAEVVWLHEPRSERSEPVRQRVLAAFGDVGLDDPPRIADSYPHQLSGGQRQRVMLAMALINRPQLVICDEPTTGLDVLVQDRILTLLDGKLADTGAACLFVSHDLAVVARLCTDVLVMWRGRIVEAGPVDHVLREPRHPYTRGLIATARIEAVTPGQRLPVLEDFMTEEEPA